ncbi:hypothetical protein GQ44DRAFT_785751 [Phaeosphaeriaceae sp. PMI808]|nr:hypothetical protein GQ44DRAFT_785751 [Phaeosphaeriaceae sp. PMI808]
MPTASEQQHRITIAFLTLAWLFILLRIWTRSYLISNFGWDDSTMILAAVRPWQMSLVYINVGINIVSSAATIFYVLFRCGSSLENYALHQLSDRCTSQKLDRFVSYQQAVVTTLTDLVFVALPMIILWNASMSRRSKVSVGFILGLATIGVIFSILRFPHIEGLIHTENFFQNAVDISMWSTIECGASIIAGCLATLRPILTSVASHANSPSMLWTSVERMSRSFRSTKPSELPHYNSVSSVVKNDATRTETPGTTLNEPAFAEFLARPGEEVIALSDRSGQVRTSVEQLIQQHATSPVEFPWPAKINKDRKRQTIHGNWALERGVATVGRTNGRQLSN